MPMEKQQHPYQKLIHVLEAYIDNVSQTCHLKKHHLSCLSELRMVLKEQKQKLQDKEEDSCWTCK